MYSAMYDDALCVQMLYPVVNDSGNQFANK